MWNHCCLLLWKINVTGYRQCTLKCKNFTINQNGKHYHGSKNNNKLNLNLTTLDVILKPNVHNWAKQHDYYNKNQSNVNCYTENINLTSKCLLNIRGFPKTVDLIWL